MRGFRLWSNFGGAWGSSRFIARGIWSGVVPVGGVLPPGGKVLLGAKWVGGAVGRTTDGVVG